jgi:fatty-acyl-CoA synthase
MLAVCDPDTGMALPHGASGELWIDAPSRFVEYLDNPSATARAIDADGMFRTGDLAHLTDLGFIFEARIGDAMRLGGFLVSPEEIEAVIQAQDRGKPQRRQSAEGAPARDGGGAALRRTRSGERDSR